MRRPVLLALLLVLALPMGAAGAPTDGPVASADSLGDIAILTLNGSARSSFATPGVDVSTAMAVQHDAAAARLDRYALEERLRQTDSAKARQALLADSAATVERRIASLLDEERALRTAYAEREVDTGTFVRGLVRIHARAGEIRVTLNRIQGHADATPEFSMHGRVRLLSSKLVGYRGPVRGHVVAAVLGHAPPTRVYVEGSGDGWVLAMLDGGQFVRESYRADQHTPDTVSSFSLDEAASRAFELYPEAYNQSQAIGFGQNIDGSIGGNVYLVQFSLPTEAGVDAYLDDETRNVFFEIQERRLDLLGDRPTVEGAANGTRLVVHRSYVGGPLQVHVANNETGDPRQAAVVVVDGERLETDADGTAWTLSPSGAFEVTALGPRGNVTVTVRPILPTRVNAEG